MASPYDVLLLLSEHPLPEILPAAPPVVQKRIHAVSFQAVKFARIKGGPFTDFFCNFEQPIEFEGNTFMPLDFAVAGREVSTSMEVPRLQIVCSNVANKVIDWLEDHEIEIMDNPVTIHWLQIDEALNIVREANDVNMRVMMLSADERAATFQIGYGFGLDDKIPRETMELDEFPMLRADGIPVAV